MGADSLRGRFRLLWNPVRKYLNRDLKEEMLGVDMIKAPSVFKIRLNSRIVWGMFSTWAIPSMQVNISNESSENGRVLFKSE